MSRRPWKLDVCAVLLETSSTCLARLDSWSVCLDDPGPRASGSSGLEVDESDIHLEISAANFCSKSSEIDHFSK